MTFRTPMRRRFPAALVLTAMLLIVPAASATAADQVARTSTISNRVCPIAWWRSTWHVKRLIRCSAHHWGVPGGATKALSIARRESRFHPGAYNAYSGASGIYQHLRRYWPGRASTWGFSGWSAFNARANIMVTMRWVHRLRSWHPWGA